MPTTVNIQDELIERIKTAPEGVLQRMLGFLDGWNAAVAYHQKQFELTESQKESLDRMDKDNESVKFRPADSFLQEFKEKYNVSD